MTSPTISNQRQGVAIPLTLTLTHQAIGSFFILSVSAMAPFLQDTLARAELIIGFFPSLAYLIAMGSSPIAHRVFDRFGPLGTSNLAILTGLAGYAVLTLTTPWAFFIAAILMGIAYGPLNPTSSVVLNQLAPPHRRNLVLALKQSGVPLGGAVAGTTLPVIASYLGYQMATIITGVVIAGLLVGFWPRSRRIDAHIETPIRQAAAPEERVFHRGCMLLASSSFCYSFVQLALSMFLGLLAFRLAGFTPVEAGLVLTVFHLSGMVGRPGWGMIADAIQGWGSALPIVGLITSTLTGLLVALTSMADPGAWMFYALAVGLGACASGWNGVFFAELAQAVPASALGAVTGQALSITFAGVVVGPSVVGFLLSSIDPSLVLTGLVALAAIGSLLAWSGVTASRQIMQTPSETPAP